MRAWLCRLLRGASPPLRAARWVVVDCETSGLDPRRDRLLSVGAVALRGGRIEVGEAFEAVLRQAAPSVPENILVHGIGGDAQARGREPGEALRDFAGFLAGGLPAAFHASFDAAVLRRAMAGLPAPRNWLDLAQLAPALLPAQAATRRTLDDWLGHFRIDAPARHDALQDAFATAQLLQVLLAEAERQGVRDVAGLRGLSRAARWTGARWL